MDNDDFPPIHDNTRKSRSRRGSRSRPSSSSRSRSRTSNRPSSAGSDGSRSSRSSSSLGRKKKKGSMDKKDRKSKKREKAPKSGRDTPELEDQPPLPTLPPGSPPAGWIIGQTDAVEDHYSLGERLGDEGASGYAVKATHKATGEVRAVKVMAKEGLEKVELDALRNEILLMTKLEHKNIVRAHDFFESSSHLYIAMELCSGGELYARITDSGSLPEEECVKIMKQIAAALKYLHSFPIAHCDIKPDNFMFKPSKSGGDTLKLIDFGTSQAVRRGNYLSASVGSPYYIAPEVVTDPPRYTEACDLWSVGCQLFVMLFGFPPFDADDLDSSMILRQLDAGFENVTKPGKGSWFPEEKKVSDQAKSLVAGLLEMDVTRRLSAVEVSEHPWLGGSKAKRTTKLLKNLSKLPRPTSLRNLVLSNSDTLQLMQLWPDADLLDSFAWVANGANSFAAADLEKREWSSKDAAKIVKVCDINRDGKVDAEDFQKACMHLKVIAKEQRLKALFVRLNASRSGSLTPDDLRATLKITSNEAKEVIEEACSGSKVSWEDFCGVFIKRKNSGLQHSNTKASGRSPLGLKLDLDFQGPGVTVEQVEAGLPAADAGIQAGDVIKKLNVKEIEDVEHFRDLGKSLVSGTKAMFLVSRDGQDKIFMVKL